MNTQEDIVLKFTVTPTNPTAPLNLTVTMDNQVVWQGEQVTDSHSVQYVLPGEDGEHRLVFELSGKLPSHTTIDEKGNILTDSIINIHDVYIDDVSIDFIMPNIAVYEHDTNGTTALAQHKFYGHLGCNGQASIVFTAPFYLWMLENL